MVSAEKDAQAFLRFLTQEAKLSLPLAVRAAQSLQEAKLTNAEQVAACDLKYVEGALPSAKDAKKIWNSAKRSVKKRPAEGAAGSSPAIKKSKTKTTAASMALGPDASPAALEAALALPMTADTDEISKTVVTTNRAPLVLAVAVTVAKYTMPQQPLSSRLSLAQAVVSANSRTRAGNLGIVTGPSAEEEGWGRGQPTVKLLGRDINVLRRYGYNWKDTLKQQEGPEDEASPAARDKSKSDGTCAEDVESDEQPALWGLDLEALRNTNSSSNKLAAGSSSCSGYDSTLPIHRPESARDYLLKSFSFYGIQSTENTDETKETTKRRPDPRPDKEACLGLVLGAVDELCRSWAPTLDRDELDRRAWSWYVKVRPEVQDGVSGWGQKGLVRLIDILDMKKKEK